MQLLDLLLGLAVLVAQHALDELARFIPEIVVAHVHLDLAVIDVDDVRADVVQKVAVVRDDDDGALILDKEILEPCDRLRVEAVRRLVEQNHIRLAEQRARQKHLDLLGLVQRAHRAVHAAAVEAEALHQLRGLGFGVPAV